MKSVAERWKKMSAEEKARYKDMADGSDKVSKGWSVVGSRLDYYNTIMACCHSVDSRAVVEVCAPCCLSCLRLEGSTRPHLRSNSCT